MKKYLLAILTIVGLLFVTSCSESDNEDATLTLSQKVIEFEKDAAEETVAVTTDVDHWSAIGSADWINVKVSGTSLIVKVNENKTVYAREGRVLVIAGNANETIDIMQKGLKGSATVLPEKINVEDTKGQFAVEVDANDRNWSAESDSEWLTVTAKPYKAELILNYEQNSKAEDRTALVTITVGNDKTQVEVTQLGRMFFLLPYKDLLGGTAEEIINFEKERRNKFNEEKSDEQALSFITRSTTMFPMLDYIFAEDGKIAKAVLFAKDADLMQANLADFEKYLLDNGFVKEGSIFLDKENAIKAQVIFVNSWFGPMAHVEFKPIPKQDKDYPTFTKFPYGFMEWGVKKDRIDVYEKEEGGTFNSAASVINDPKSSYDFLWYDIDEEKQGEGDLYARVYFIDKDDQPEPGLSEAVQIMKKTTLVFFTAHGEAVITKEFKALCKKEGFVYHGISGDFHVFKNTNKKLMLAVRQHTFQGETTPSLILNVAPIAEDGSALKSLSRCENILKVKM